MSREEAFCHCSAITLSQDICVGRLSVIAWHVLSLKEIARQFAQQIPMWKVNVESFVY